MAKKNFTEFDLEATPSGGDFVVGYAEDGSKEIRVEIETLPVNAHKTNHAVGGSDVLSPSDIGAVEVSSEALLKKLTISAPNANTALLAFSGFSLTGSNAQSLVDLAGTWSTSGTPTAFKLNVTDTASNAASLLLDLQVDGTSKFKVTKAGQTTVDELVFTNLLTGVIYAGDGKMQFRSGSANEFEFQGYQAEAASALIMYLRGRITVDSNGLWSLRNAANNANSPLIVSNISASSSGDFSNPSVSCGEGNGLFHYDNNLIFKYTNTAQILFRHVDGFHILDTYGGKITWGDFSTNRSVGTINNTFSPVGVGIFQFGANHATTPTTQTIKAHDVSTGTGAKLILKGGSGSNGDGAVEIGNEGALSEVKSGLSVNGYTHLSGNKLSSAVFDPSNNGPLWTAAFDLNLITPPSNSFSSFGYTDAYSTTLILLSSNSIRANYSVEVQFSLDDSTWHTWGSSTVDNSTPDFSITILSLSPETTYWIRWRSHASYCYENRSEWSLSQTVTTFPTT